VTVEEQGAGSYMPPGTTEAIANWWGIIKSTDSGAQYDDYFERQDTGQVIYFGIDSMDPAVKSQIEALRDSGRTVHLYGTLVSNVPDYNGTVSSSVPGSQSRLPLLKSAQAICCPSYESDAAGSSPTVWLPGVVVRSKYCKTFFQARTCRQGICAMG
jgi:hypothetical protein